MFEIHWEQIVRVPDDEVGAGLSHDLLLVHDVLLLPRLHNVVLLENFEGERPRIVIVHLNLQQTVSLNCLF